MPWRWKNLEVFEAWAATRELREGEAVKAAIEQAAAGSAGYPPGEQVEPYSGPYMRVIHTDVADIYFTTYGYAWNSAHDTLHLLDIVSR